MVPFRTIKLVYEFDTEACLSIGHSAYKEGFPASTTLQPCIITPQCFTRYSFTRSVDLGAEKLTVILWSCQGIASETCGLMTRLLIHWYNKPQTLYRLKCELMEWIYKYMGTTTLLNMGVIQWSTTFWNFWIVKRQRCSRYTHNRKLEICLITKVEWIHHHKQFWGGDDDRKKEG